MRLQDMSAEELFQISLRRDKETGCYTTRALKAQAILWQRSEDSRWSNRQEWVLDDGVVDRDYTEMQYNGYMG